MSYRVELARSGRAVCKDTVCKQNGVKIGKNELRLGTWVTFEDRGSWTWKHWGCVTGRQLQNMRGQLSTGPDEYDFDMLDGYDDDDPSGLKLHPELQEKVRRVITQGFIDPEDWKGDPEMNVLGKTGTRSVESKRAIAKEKKERQAELEASGNPGGVMAEEDAPVATPIPAQRKKSISKKRAKDESDAEDEMPAKKKRGGKVKKDEETDAEDKMPSKKKRGGKVKKEEESDEEVMPTKKSRGKAVKKEEPAVKDEDEPMLGIDDSTVAKAEPFDESVELSAPVKKSRAKKGAKKVVKEEKSAERSDITEPISEPAPAKETRGRKSTKKAVKEDDGPQEALGAPDFNEAKDEPVVKSEVETSAPARRNQVKKGAKKAVKAVDSFNSSEAAEGDEQEPVAKDDAPVKNHRAKKGGNRDAVKETLRDSETNEDSEPVIVKPKKGRRSKLVKSS